MAAVSRIFSILDFFLRRRNQASDAFSWLSKSLQIMQKEENKKSSLTLEGCNHSISHFDGFNLNVIIKNKHIFNFRLS